MTFLHSGLLIALALTAVPVVLHLLLRQKPKRLDFPALRLVKTKSRKSTKRLRLRHLLLLLLRVLVIAAMVFAAARPLLPAAEWGFRWWEGLLLATLVAAGVAAQLWWTNRTRRAAGQSTRESLQKRGGSAIWSAVAALMALIVFLPYGLRVSASMKEAPTAEALDLPVAGVFVFDVSPSMTYRESGQPLLDTARKIVAEHVGALPAGSRVAVTDNATEQPLLFQVSLSSVPAQLERLTPSATARSLNASIAAAFEAHRVDREAIRTEGDDRDRFVRRIYVVTDLTKTAWKFPDGSSLAEAAAAENGPSLFLLDVGVEAPLNRGFAQVKLSSDELPRGGQLTVRTQFHVTERLAAEAGESETSAELFLADGGKQARVGSQQASSDGQSLAFQPMLSTANDLAEGTLRLGQADPFAIDDVRYFTVGVTPLPKLLFVADDEKETFDLRFMLEGDENLRVPSRYEITTIDSVRLSDATLESQDVVCLINVRRLSDRQWSDLEAFVRAGGGLATFLGSNDIESFGYSRAAAQDVLPATVDVYGSQPSDDPARMIFPSRTGSFVERLAQFDGTIEILGSCRIKRFWRVQPRDDAKVIARFTVDALPALVSRPVGKGLSMMLTTGLNIRKPLESWNNLMQPDNAYWVGIAFCDQLMRHLARVGSTKRNFVAGDVPSVPLSDQAANQRVGDETGDRENVAPEIRPTTEPAVTLAPLRLRTPDLKNLPLTQPENGPLLIPQATVPGHYRVMRGSEVLAGFSVNYPEKESDLTRVTTDDLASIFGDETFEIARGLDELNEDIDVARFGQEAFPFLVLLVILFFAGETLLSSRFYGDDPKPKTVSRDIPSDQDAFASNA